MGAELPTVGTHNQNSKLLGLMIQVLVDLRSNFWDFEVYCLQITSKPILPKFLWDSVGSKSQLLELRLQYADTRNYFSNSVWCSIYLSIPRPNIVSFCLSVSVRWSKLISLIVLVISNLLWPFSTHLLFFHHTPLLMKVCGKIHHMWGKILFLHVSKSQ